MAKTLEELRTYASSIRDENNEGGNTALRVGRFFINLIDGVFEFITNLIGGYYTKKQVDDLLGAVQQFRYVLADILPTASADTMGVIYFIPSSDGQSGNLKDEYMTLMDGSNYRWEKVGSTEFRIENYYTKNEVSALMGNKADTDFGNTNLSRILGYFALKDYVTASISALGTVLRECGELDFFESSERSKLYNAKKGDFFRVPFSFTYNGVTYPSNTGIIVISDSNDPSTFSSRVFVLAPNLSGKVDKESGKGLSSNDYTTTEKNKLAALPTRNDLNTTFEKKVDSGKGILALAMAAGFTYDAQTGTYSHRFLSKYDEEGVEKDFYMTGLTEKDVANILRVTARPMQRYGWWPGGSTMQRIKCTAEINGAFIYRPAIDTSSLCYQQFDLEVFWPCDDYRSTSERAGLLTSNATSMFNECRNLRRTTAIDVKDCASVNNMFKGCSSLVETRIYGLHGNISFEDSPLLSLASLRYMVDHARAYTPGAETIIIKVHWDIYSAHFQIHHIPQDKWDVLYEDALAKGIEFDADMPASIGE